MKIDLTKEQFHTLMEMVYLGNWMATSHLDDVPEDREKYEEMESTIFAMAKEFGLADLAEVDEDGVFPTAKFEGGPIMEIIDDYDDATFWEQLAEALSLRDVVEQYGEEEFNKLTPEERLKIRDKAYWTYLDEFNANGLERLRVDKGPVGE